MKSNRFQVEKIQKRSQTSMIKDGTFEAHKEDMQKAFASGAVRDITTKEMEQWCRLVHFLTLFSSIRRLLCPPYGG